MMLRTALVTIMLAAVPATLAAQTPTPPGVATPTASPRFTLETPIETIAADPAGKAVLSANFPGMLDHPAYPDFKSMSLSQVQPMSQGQITDAQIAKAKGELAAIK